MRTDQENEASLDDYKVDSVPSQYSKTSDSDIIKSDNTLAVPNSVEAPSQVKSTEVLHIPSERRTILEGQIGEDSHLHSDRITRPL